MNSKTLESRLHALANHPVFEWTAVCVIITSALLLGAKTFEISETSTRLLAWLDWAITVFFVAEISLRFYACPDKKRFFSDPWNLFDTIIVSVSLMPVPSGDQALIARLIRVFRVLRMVSIIPELRILLNSLIKALPQLGYVILLMFIIFYIYAAIGTTLFEQINPTLWGDIAISLLTLFRVMTFEDWTDVMYETMAVYPISWAYYLSFIFFTAFAFLNMVIGIVVNVLDQEQSKAYKAAHEDEPTIASLQAEIVALRELIIEQRRI